MALLAEVDAVDAATDFILALVSRIIVLVDKGTVGLANVLFFDTNNIFLLSISWGVSEYLDLSVKSESHSFFSLILPFIDLPL